MEKKDKKKEIRLDIFIILIFFCFIGFAAFMASYSNGKPRCHKNKAELHEQYVGKLQPDGKEMLLMNVTEFVCKGTPGDGCGCQWENKIIYFEGENKTLDRLNDTKEIWINWCYIDEIDDYRVRGIEKHYNPKDD